MPASLSANQIDPTTENEEAINALVNLYPIVVTSADGTANVHVTSVDPSYNHSNADVQEENVDSHSSCSSDITKFTSYEHLKAAIDEIEITTITCYRHRCKRASGNHGLSFKANITFQDYVRNIKSAQDIWLKWHSDASKLGDCTPIEFNGHPFVLLNKTAYSCHKGKDYDKVCNEKKKSKMQSQPDELKARKRKGSKKVDCPAQFTCKQVLYFPGYKLDQNATEYKKKMTNKRLKDDIMKHVSKLKDQGVNGKAVTGDETSTEREVSDQPSDIQVCLLYLTKLPKPSDHKFHTVGIAADANEKTDERIVAYIKTLVRKGITERQGIDRLVEAFVRKKLHISGHIHLRDRFHPSRKTQLNIIGAVRAETPTERENAMEISGPSESEESSDETAQDDFNSFQLHEVSSEVIIANSGLRLEPTSASSLEVKKLKLIDELNPVIQSVGNLEDCSTIELVQRKVSELSHLVSLCENETSIC